MKIKYFTIVTLSALTVTSCGPNAEQQAAKEKALIDSAVSATARNMTNESENNNSSQEEAGGSSTSEEVENYDWSGTYSVHSDNVDYNLIVSKDAPMSWTEYGWEMEASGNQTYFKINGYAIRDSNGNLEFHYMDQVDGAFYQSEKMDINAVMFKLSRKGNSFNSINGMWKAKDYFNNINKK